MSAFVDSFPRGPFSDFYVRAYLAEQLAVETREGDIFFDKEASEIVAAIGPHPLSLSDQRCALDLLDSLDSEDD